MSWARTITLLLLFAPLVLGGCDRAEQLWSSLGGSGEAEDEDEAEDERGEAQRRLERERQLAEAARLEAERRERERIAAKQRRLELERGDALVERWAEQLAGEKSPDEAFVRHEGLTEDDPWATQLRVRYVSTKEGERETLEVRSAGPNGTFDDDDDLVRTRTTQIERSWWQRNKLWLLVTIAWLGVGFVSAGGMRRRRLRRHGSEREGLDATDVLISLVYIVFAPLTMLFWLLVLLLELMGALAD